MFDTNLAGKIYQEGTEAFSALINLPLNYTVVFVTGPEEHRVCLGSGTLIKHSSVHGILTCRHVVERGLKLRSEVRIAAIGNNSKAFYPLKIPIDTADSVLFAESNSVLHGPDLAFLRLDEIAIEKLSAASSFLNAALQAEITERGEPDYQRRFDFVFGSYEELNAKRFVSPTTAQITVTVHRTDGQVTKVERNQEFDYFWFLPHNLGTNSIVPVRYNGTSGGGLWSFYFREMAKGQLELTRWNLVGVAYYQTNETESRILGHGPRSIYQKLLGQIIKKWPS